MKDLTAPAKALKAATLDLRINALAPGQEMELGRSGDVHTTVERSGDGKTLRFIRYSGAAWEVYKTTKF